MTLISGKHAGIEDPIVILSDVSQPPFIVAQYGTVRVGDPRTVHGLLPRPVMVKIIHERFFVVDARCNVFFLIPVIVVIVLLVVIIVLPFISGIVIRNDALKRILIVVRFVRFVHAQSFVFHF